MAISKSYSNLKHVWDGKERGNWKVKKVTKYLSEAIVPGLQWNYHHFPRLSLEGEGFELDKPSYVRVKYNKTYFV